MKSLTIIAGANGSGKTTFALEYCHEYGLEFITVDISCQMKMCGDDSIEAKNYSWKNINIWQMSG